MLTRRALRPGTQTADQAVAAVLSAAGRIEQALEQVLERHDITADQYRVLRILQGFYPSGQPRGEVARCCSGRSPDMTRMLDRLETRGLASRAPDPEDGRCSVAKITNAGMALLARIDPEVSAEARVLMGRLSAAQLRQLARACEALESVE